MVAAHEVDAAADEPLLPLLLEPAGGVPDVVDAPERVPALVASLAAGTGPLAVDAERASGYRYAQRAYLVQLRRAGAGTVLIDPIGTGDLTVLGAGLQPAEWILHAASQDLACLAELGLVPQRLFDTELAARLLGFPRVALGTMVAELLGVRLEKGHSAADWSTRPLPDAWLAYAALDVELLIELRDALAARLDAAGKREWAEQEFAATLAAAKVAPAARAEPWRRTSGIHQLRTPRQLAAVRALWEARDERARARDLAPGRVLPDKAIVSAALTAPADREALLTLPIFSGPRMRRSADVWWNALARAYSLPASALPRMTARTGDGPPPANRWAEREPAAAERLATSRAAVAALAETLEVPAENLLEPALLRRLAWDPPADVRAGLADGGARPWQVDLVANSLADAFRA
ncbi:MAG TPA: HRDC domain-containing protein [Mycobacteriales bacterium]